MSYNLDMSNVWCVVYRIIWWHDKIKFIENKIWKIAPGDLGVYNNKMSAKVGTLNDLL